jgi:hypothetical protein
MIEIIYRDRSREVLSIENYRNRVFRRDPLLLMARVSFHSVAVAR